MHLLPTSVFLIHIGKLNRSTLLHDIAPSMHNDCYKVTPWTLFFHDNIHDFTNHFTMISKKNQFGGKKSGMVKQQCLPIGHKKWAGDFPPCLIGSTPPPMVFSVPCKICFESIQPSLHVHAWKKHVTCVLLQYHFFVAAAGYTFEAILTLNSSCDVFFKYSCLLGPDDIFFIIYGLKHLNSSKIDVNSRIRIFKPNSHTESYIFETNESISTNFAEP